MRSRSSVEQFPSARTSFVFRGHRNSTCIESLTAKRVADAALEQGEGV